MKIFRPLINFIADFFFYAFKIKPFKTAYLPFFGRVIRFEMRSACPQCGEVTSYNNIKLHSVIDDKPFSDVKNGLNAIDLFKNLDSNFSGDLKSRAQKKKDFRNALKHIQLLGYEAIDSGLDQKHAIKTILCSAVYLSEKEKRIPYLEFLEKKNKGKE